MSYTALRARFTVGSTVRVTNNRFPNRSGIRPIVKVQTNGIYTRIEDGPDAWVGWPKVADVHVWEPDTPGEGVPRIEFLNGDGSAAFIYELLEEAWPAADKSDRIGHEIAADSEGATERTPPAAVSQ